MHQVLQATQRFATKLQVCLFALIFLATCTSSAQIAGTGSIQGTVLDASGASLQGASVAAINTATHVKRDAVTEKAGAFLFPNIAVGTYDLQVTAPGFETYVQTGIVLEVGSSVSISASLKVGKQDERVEVHADGIALQTEDSSFKQTIDQNDVQEMPLNGRQMTSLITLSGGSSPAPAGDFTGSKYSYQTISVSVAGGMGNTTNWKLDGGENGDFMSNGNLPFPFPDAVAEFSVESTALGPQNGLHSGGLVNVVTRSGTNQYHGTAFEFIRNNYVDATNFFAATKDQLHQNQYGGTFGGRILRDKLFAFAGYQRLVSKVLSTNVSMYVPTAANLAGDWSTTNPCASPNAAGLCTGGTQLYDPITGVPLKGNKYASTPTYNAQALALQKYFPAINPAVDTTNQGLVKFGIPTDQFDNEFVTRVDYTVNQKNNIFGRYFLDSYQAPSFYQPNNILITYLAPGNYERVQTATMGWARTFSSSLVNDFHITGTKRVDLRQSAPGINGNTIGITESTLLSTGLQITAATSGKPYAWSSYCGTCSNGYFNVDSEGGQDELTWIKGKHQLSVGGEYTRVHFNEVVGYEANGNFTFNGSFSSNGPTGVASAVPCLSSSGTPQACAAGNANLDFMAGALSSFQQSKEQQLALRGPVPSLYLQDTFHASKEVTIVAGIRWAPEFMPFDYFNRGVSFDASRFAAGTTSSVYTTAPAGVYYYGDPGVPRAFTNSTIWQFNPNAGISYAPSQFPNTVIRAGVSSDYDEANWYTGNRVHQSPPFATAANPAISGPICFSQPWLTGGTGYGCSQVGGTNTSPFPQPAFPTPAQAIFPSQGQYIVLPTQFHVARTLQWTASVQHQFPHGWQLQLDYIGNTTSNMPMGTPLDLANYTPGVWGANGTGCGSVVTTGAAAKAAGTTGGGKVGTACSTTSNQQARFALTEINSTQGNQIQGGGGGSVMIDDRAYANYNGLVASLQHRLSSTFSLLSNITYSKCLNVSDAGGDVAAGGNENPSNLALDYGRCGSDYRKIFNTTIISRSDFKGLSKPVGFLVNNWEIGPLVHILSGGAINVTSGSDLSLTDTGNDRPNVVPGVNPINFVKITSAAATQANRGYINLNAFCSAASAANACSNPVAAGTFGNLGRNTVSGPMFFQFDSQISRTFPIYEKVNVLFRLEAYNLLNHPNFANPSSSNPSAASFGEITATTGGTGGLQARLFQGALKVSF